MISLEEVVQLTIRLLQRAEQAESALKDVQRQLDELRAMPVGPNGKAEDAEVDHGSLR